MTTILHPFPPVNTYRNNVLAIFFNAGEPDVDPFPTFDLEINKEDKDSDIENPEIKKDPRIDKTGNDEASDSDN